MKKPCNRARIGQQRTRNTQRKTASLAWSCGTVELPANTTAGTVLGGSGIQERAVHQKQSGKAVKKKYKDWDSPGRRRRQRPSTDNSGIHTDAGWIKVKIKESSRPGSKLRRDDEAIVTSWLTILSERERKLEPGFGRSAVKSTNAAGLCILTSAIHTTDIIPSG